MASKAPPQKQRAPSDLVKIVDDTVRIARLTLALIGDKRVKPALKLLPIFGVLYVISPIDLLPAVVCGPLGALDDVTVMVITIAIFLHFIPKPIVQEVRTQIG